MKKNLLAKVFVLVFTIITGKDLVAQSINVVPNPTVSSSFSWVNNGIPNALSGYAGGPIVFNNTLVLEYNATNNASVSGTVQATLQLAVYNGGDSLHLIPNPDGGAGVYLQSVQLIFNNKLFFIYFDVNNIQRLASFDGTSITLYPNPDASTIGYIGSPRILNNNLYVLYVNSSNVTQFGLFNGSGISLIPNPDASTVGFYNDYSVVFNNKIVSRYVTAAGPKQLASFDGTSWTLIPNPDNVATRGFQPIFPIAYHNKLYWIYFGNANQYQFAVYDGVNNPTLLTNPEDDSPNQGGVSGFPIIYDDTLFFQYADINNVGRLAKCDGTTITLIPNPDNTTYGFYNVPIVYNNNLYIFYVTPDGLHHIGEYEGVSNTLKVYPNPDGGSGYWDQPIVYDNNLYFIYYNVSGYSQLGYFNGNTIRLIANPTGAYTSPNGNNGYLGQPIIWNSLLYLQMASIPYANAGNLGYFDGSTLPISLVKFTAQQNGNTSLLKWQVANETNNDYFSIERSSDGTNFLPIGKVAGHGTIATQQDYQFTDENPVKGMNYYRLKQVDYDGNFAYSNVATVSFNNNTTVFSVFPNPARNNVYFNIPESTSISVIRIFDSYGKKVMEKQIGNNTITQSLDVSALASGVYQVTLIQGTEQQTLHLVKE